MKHVVVLTGAGISAESGLKTFRDHDGLWEGHRVEEVATPEAWRRDPEMVQRFYDERRKGVLAASPNAGHEALVRLEDGYKVSIVTQNIDDLHERAGSSNVLHLHGVITKARSSVDPNDFYEIDGWELPMGRLCKHGSQLRPDVVWFGEPVPAMQQAASLASTADIMLVVGTSLVVYPAAGLVDYVRRAASMYVIDPKTPQVTGRSDVTYVQEPATSGVPDVVETLLSAV